ncbi:hypothetical protein KP509_33G002300 [Ceratopteris richardii]|nr:hypothetical protein KP509_33G002300 [Ceratopteris richardii]
MAGSESDSLMKGGDGISSHSDQSSNLSDCSQVLQYFNCSDGFSASASLLSSIGFGEGGQTLLNSANVSATSASSLTTGGNSIISSNSTLQQNMNTRADSMTSTGAASMGLPTSPLSFSSSNVGLPGSSAFSMASLSHSGLASMNRPEMLRDPSVHPSKLVKLENGYKPVFNGMPSKSGWQYGLNNSDAARQVLGTGRVEQQLKTQGLITSQQHFHMNEEPLTQLQGSLPAVKVANKDLLQQQAAFNRLQCGNPLSAAQIHRYDLLQQQPSHVHHQLLQQRLLRMLPPQVQRSHIVQQQHQLQQQQQQQQQQQLLLLQQLQQVTGMGKKHDKTLPGSCSQRVMEYMHHQRMHPVENDIGFWREFTAEFFAPSARKRWCLFRCSSGGWSQRSGIFPQELWCCEICGTSPGRGFEVSVEVMPRLYKSKFDNGEFEELLFIDRPHEYRLSSGQIVLEYDKAVQESVYEQLRVVWEGQLRIIFTTELKILSWDFCAGSHEELLPRRSIVPQVNQLVALASRYQSMVQNSGNNLSAQELQAICKL